VARGATRRHPLLIPGGKVFYRINAESIYAYNLTNLQGHDKARLSFMLIASLDPGCFNPVTRKFNLAAKGAADTGPFTTISASTTIITFTSRLTAARGYSTLLEAWGNVSRASAYLLKRAHAVVPRSPPKDYKKEDVDEAGRDKVKTMPLSVKQERPRIRAQAEKRVRAFFEHVRYVSSQGRLGTRLRRKCLGCKREVIIGLDGSHHLDEDGEPRHNECFAKVEAWIAQHKS
jgi:hypothetical protein